MPSGARDLMQTTMTSVERPVDAAQPEMTGGSVCQFVAQTTEPTSLESGVDSSLNVQASADEINATRAFRLTARQQAILDFIRERIKTKGHPPTFREIGKNFGIRSTNGVNDHLRALERKGALLRTPGLSRSSIPATRPADADDSPDVAAMYVAEIEALRTLLRRALHAGRRLPTLSAEMVVVLGDVRDALAGRAT